MEPQRASRLDKRESVMMRAQIWVPGARAPSDCRVRNLSLSGACIISPGRLRRGDAIRASIGHVEDVDAEVMWVTADAAGIRFEDPIDLAAARRSRSAGVAQAGWIGGMNDFYRR
ncbi:PilZ domain-containing protein [Sphingomonas sp. LB-2]|uniref:PilZ domain-containing protein n=1 Tax=Sphingomonas caeni TaxID=2984949 RepID=UPI0022325202|nr:PilZ domain-containing protein [Sphingomonas caeni]MCW3848423.1 PilZ domain-containing protein [Sphingomonas caeni]